MRSSEEGVSIQEQPPSALRTPYSALGLYIHIPFCRARCSYCDFVTFTDKEDAYETYVQALCKEIELYEKVHESPSSGSATFSPGRRNFPAFPSPGGEGGGEGLTQISTVYFGGGTPSLLEPGHMRAIFSSLRQRFELDPGAEITLEANPESVRLDKLDAWKDLGVNRLSIGLQAYDNSLLKAMRRLHTVEEFCAVYELARRRRISNISVDLIYGFPGQSMDAWKHTVVSVSSIEPEHLSLYALKVEEHTPYGAQGVAVDNDLQADMYDWARSYLPARRFEQYEISNFARPGWECRHNLIYWRGQDYVGLGVSAVGCVDGLRWQNHKNLGAYYKDIAAGRLPWASTEELSASTRKFERLMLGLRLREGYHWEEENPAWLVQRERLSAQGQLEEIQPGTWRIPEPYVPLTNQILLPFLS